jgi:hypothetical protein
MTATQEVMTLQELAIRHLEIHGPARPGAKLFDLLTEAVIKNFGQDARHQPDSYRRLITAHRCLHRDDEPETARVGQKLTYALCGQLASANDKDAARLLRDAASAWSAITQVEFEELEPGSLANLEFYPDTSMFGSRVVKPVNAINRQLVFVSDNRGCDPIKLRKMLMHLIGHALGFNHRTEPSIMSPYFTATSMLFSAKDMKEFGEVYARHRQEPPFIEFVTSRGLKKVSFPANRGHE